MVWASVWHHSQLHAGYATEYKGESGSNKKKAKTRGDIGSHTTSRRYLHREWLDFLGKVGPSWSNTDSDHDRYNGRVEQDLVKQQRWVRNTGAGKLGLLITLMS